MIEHKWQSGCPKTVDRFDEQNIVEWATVSVKGETWGNVQIAIDDFPAYRFHLITLQDIYSGKKPMRFIIDIHEPAPTYEIFDDPIDLIVYLRSYFDDYDVYETLKDEVFKPMLFYFIWNSLPVDQRDREAIEAKVDDTLP